MSKQLTKEEVMGNPYDSVGEGEDEMLLYNEFQVREIMDTWGRIKWDEAQHDAMQFNVNRNSRSPAKYPVGRFTPYKK